MYFGYLLLFLAVLWIIFLLSVRISSNIILFSFLSIWFSILGFVLSKAGLIAIFYVLAVLLLLLFLFLSFFSDRVYNYLFSIIFLIMAIFLLVLKLNKISEVLAGIAFLFLVLGFLKDVFYEKLIKN